MINLKLRATEPSDIEVIASAVQDSIFQLGQTRYNAEAMSFTLRLSRYMHEAKTPQRIESGVRFDGVQAVRSHGVALDKKDAFVVILNLEFETKDSPAGTYKLTLAGGGVVQIDAEAVDITLADVGEPRKTKRIPKHDR